MITTREQILDWLSKILSVDPQGTMVLGINGPQGSGKSTLAKSLCESLATKDKKAVTVSIDDFYYTRHGQIWVAQKHSGNPYLQQRGYPGTHDTKLGAEVLHELKELGDGTTKVPRYDKSLHGGLGDRLAESEWPTVEGPIDVIILEGWMLGFRPVPQKELPNSHFRKINSFLKGYEAWYSVIDAFLQLRADDYRHVLHWRVEAEERMKASGKPGLSEAEISRYIELFLPAYATYLPGLADNPPAKDRHLVVTIGKERLPSC